MLMSFRLASFMFNGCISVRHFSKYFLHTFFIGLKREKEKNTERRRKKAINVMIFTFNQLQARQNENPQLFGQTERKKIEAHQKSVESFNVL